MIPAIAVIALLPVCNLKQALAYQNVVIVIDPGHGGTVTDDNSNGGAIYNNVMEKDANLATAIALYNELSTYYNVTPYLTRTEDVEMSIAQRIDFAKSVNADFVVSVHYNASENHNFYGSEIFTSMYGESNAYGYGMGLGIQKRWESFGTVSKGIKTREGDNGDYYGLIRQGYSAGIPVIILEHGYLDNDKDSQRIANAMAWEELGIMDAQGIAEYYGLKKDLVQENITPTVNITIPTNPMKPDTTPPTNVKLTIDSYDQETGEIKYSLSASENEENLMYYGFHTGDINKDTVFEELELWDNAKGIQNGVYMAPAGYSGKITARVYNTYELYADSDTSIIGTEGNDEGNDETDGTAADNIDETNGDLDENPEMTETDGSTPEILDEIIIGEEENERKKIEITSKMVDDAMEPRLESNKAMLGLIVTISVVLLVGVIAAAVVVNSTAGQNKNKKHKKNSYDWEDD